MPLRRWRGDRLLVCERSHLLAGDPGIAGGECVGPGTKDALCGLSNNSRPCADGFFCTNTVQGTCQPVHALGETCQRSAQCAAAFYCARPTGPLGTCVARQATGDNCGMHATDAGLVNRECEVGATCDIIIPADGGPSVQACVKRGELGDPCTPPYRMCTGNRLTCSAGVCSPRAPDGRGRRRLRRTAARGRIRYRQRTLHANRGRRAPR
ncbi:MAG: hypothetical protein IPG50_26805 [Myxococcales bacterium]|nr:hypothetical protein [Myxococcales bacterium]